MSIMQRVLAAIKEMEPTIETTPWASITVELQAGRVGLMKVEATQKPSHFIQSSGGGRIGSHALRCSCGFEVEERTVDEALAAFDKHLDAESRTRPAPVGDGGGEAPSPLEELLRTCGADGHKVIWTAGSVAAARAGKRTPKCTCGWSPGVALTSNVLKEFLHHLSEAIK